MTQIPQLVLENSRVIDGTGREPFIADIAIGAEGRIVSVGPTRAPTDAAMRVDLSGKTVIPGLIDCHIHLKMGTDDGWKVKASKVPVDLDMPMTMIGIRGFSRARLALRTGFTTLRDVGDVNNLAASLRDAIATGYVEGPRIVSSGEAIVMTGSTVDFLPDWLGRDDVATRRADGPQALRSTVRSVVKNGADWIKFIATGTMGPAAMEQEFDDEEVAAIIGEAHRLGRRVCAHACYAKGTLAIVRAGVDSVEHGSELTDEIVDLMCEKGTWLVPTLSLFDGMATRGRDFGLPQQVIDMAARKQERHVASFQLALRAGVNIANGSDIGSSACAHGTGARELSLLVQHGMTPMQAITTATASSARMLGMEADIGTVQAGRLADLVVMDGDPLADIDILQVRDRISAVMKSGKLTSPGNEFLSFSRAG